MNVDLIKKYKQELVSVTIGALLAYIYYAQVGSISGSCAIMSSPVYSSLYGAVFAYSVFGMFKIDKKE
jgi:hypothetical protein